MLTSRDRTIDRHELRELCAELGQRLTNEELDEAMEMLDADGSGQVDRVCTRMRRCDDTARVCECWQHTG